MTERQVPGRRTLITNHNHKRVKDRRRASAGQSLAEFVLILPIFLVITVAVGDFGRVYASGVAVEDSAREAADYAAFDDVSNSHFEEPVPGTIDATDATRAEALRRACAAVSSLPDYGPASDPASVAAFCADPTSRCTASGGPGTFCQLVVENIDVAYGVLEPWESTCGVDPIQLDATCGWVVHTTVRFDFHMVIDYLPLDFLPLPTTVNLVRESRYAISALPIGGP